MPLFYPWLQFSQHFSACFVVCEAWILFKFSKLVSTVVSSASEHWLSGNYAIASGIQAWNIFMRLSVSNIYKKVIELHIRPYVGWPTCQHIRSSPLQVDLNFWPKIAFSTRAQVPLILLKVQEFNPCLRFVTIFPTNLLLIAENVIIQHMRVLSYNTLSYR